MELSYVNGSRKELIRRSTVPRVNAPRGDWKQLRNRAGSAAAAAEMLNEALCKFIDLLYMEDSDGSGYCNIDPFTYRIEIPSPWSRLHYASYGLRRTEQGVLSFLIASTASAQGEKSLFIYEGRRWYLNADQYPTMESALEWVDRLRINGKVWKQWYAIFVQNNGKR